MKIINIIIYVALGETALYSVVATSFVINNDRWGMFINVKLETQWMWSFNKYAFLSRKNNII